MSSAVYSTLITVSILMLCSTLANAVEPEKNKENNEDLLEWLIQIKKPGWKLLKATSQRTSQIAVFVAEDRNVCVCYYSADFEGISSAVDISIRNADGKDAIDLQTAMKPISRKFSEVTNGVKVERRIHDGYSITLAPDRSERLDVHVEFVDNEGKRHGKIVESVLITKGGK